ncbi:MAG: CDP-alcohol phosphatidyltransferase family protein [Eggerthellaceae bacterium]|nr:CDP-alcohol phosphatidyltransferase family protein [Eggerthellaceae bacterium]
MNTLLDEQQRELETGTDLAVSNRIVTIPNLISLVRLGLVPVFFVLLLAGYDIVAAIVFALAAATDWLDGYIARLTNSVSKLGQLLDPVIDRVLMVSGVLGLVLIDRLPLWIVLVVILRDGALLCLGGYILAKFKLRIPVIFAGKLTTTFLMIGFAGLLLNWPLIPGLGLINVSWLPGFNADPVSWGIWFIYVGLILGIIVAVYYISTGYQKVLLERVKVGEQNT